MKPSRRALRCFVKGLRWQWQSNDVLQLSFALTAGCFATALLRELADCTTPNRAEVFSQ